MNCDCIEKIEGILAKHMMARAGDDATARIQGTAINIVDDNLKCVLTIPFRIKGSKKGFTSEKGKELPCNVSFCPFCGRTAKRYNIGKDAGISAAMKGSSWPENA